MSNDETMWIFVSSQFLPEFNRVNDTGSARFFHGGHESWDYWFDRSSQIPLAFPTSDELPTYFDPILTEDKSRSSEQPVSIAAVLKGHVFDRGMELPLIPWSDEWIQDTA